MPHVLPRLYAILDLDQLEARGFDAERVFDAWLQAGVRLMQLRAKTLPSGPMLALARRLATRAREADAIFLVNDRVDVARLAGAAGVHVGQEDLTPADARRCWPTLQWLGLSTHDESQVAHVLTQPVTYAAFGPVFPTRSKVQPDPVVGLETLSRIARRVKASERPLPLVAIGGITLASAPSVLAAGADAVAVIADLLEGDPGVRARAFLDCLGDASGEPGSATDRIS